MRRAWQKYVRDSHPITLKLIRKLLKAERLAKERQRAEAPRDTKLPSIGLSIKGKKKPAVFKHLLTIGPHAERHNALAQADALSVKPRRLYLEILKETGGGHQVQLPVASLGAFLGLARGNSGHHIRFFG
jgi:hypothetical protein